MQEIIAISKQKIGDDSVNSVSARDLHRELGVKKDFISWIKDQINKGIFEENIDFIIISLHPQKGEQRGGHNKVDYILTIDTAKHIALMSRTQKGKDVRNYFIEVEEAYGLQISEPKTEKRDDLISVSQSELDKELQTLKFILDNCNLSEKEKIAFTNQTLKKINFQTLDNPTLKKREPVFTLTQLLKDYQIPILPKDFNIKLESFGIIERSEKGWEILDMRFGENRKFDISESSTRTKNPKYYKSTFQELLDIVL